jgi:3-deoxy-D-manno-octulosonate 8-phosphate phosphatase (KDO 8-P phosphatase)
VTAGRRSGLTARARRVRLLILDVDGVLTNGGLVYGPTGEELKIFHVRDGHAIALAQSAGLAVSVVSGRSSTAVARRMADLGVTDVYQGVADKLALLTTLCARHRIDADAAAFMGDDLPDLPLLRAVGLSLAPADAVPAVRRVAHWVSRRPGGAGAVRDAIEWLLHSRAVRPGHRRR